VLRSYQRFAPGLYEVQSYSDSCYFTTPSIKYFNSNSRFYIRIDSISSTRLVGGFFGAAVAGKELYGTGMIGYSLRKGSFRTSGSF
ncbi:MAG TPA: hypothetical protein VM935_01295, partial [Chitinophagaceae bacterium]|nr:hypothetical protein [Chitinophagaceae bacterium]